MYHLTFVGYSCPASVKVSQLNWKSNQSINILSHAVLKIAFMMEILFFDRECTNKIAVVFNSITMELRFL